MNLADALARLADEVEATGSASPTNVGLAAPVSPRRDLGALPTPELTRPGTDQRDQPADRATSTVTATSLAGQPPSSRPTGPAVTAGALVAWVHADRWQYGLVVTVRKRDGMAFLVPLDAPRLNVLKPCHELVLIYAADALHAAVQARHAEVAR